MKIKLKNNIPKNIKLIVQKHEPSKRALVRLNIMDNLSNIRKKLKNHSIIKMDNTFSFSQKTPEIGDDTDDGIRYWFAEIAHEEEEDFLLKEILEEENILYLVRNSSADWKFLNKERTLDYGCSMTFNGIKRAKKRAFKMKNCDLIEIGAEGCRKGIIEVRSNEDWMMKENLFFSADVNVQNFAKLGLSIESSKNANFQTETNKTYSYIEYGKVALKFNGYLEPTKEFSEAVEDAISSGDSEKFKKITEEFGQFVPTEVILGGRMYFKEISIEGSVTISEDNAMRADILSTEITSDSGHTKGKSGRYKINCTRLIGGEQPDSLENFDDKVWAHSLKEYINWDCIEFRNPINIFTLLSEELRERIFLTIGKRILYSKFENHNYQLKVRGKQQIFELKEIPSNILDIIHDRNDCNFFATVVEADDKETNDFFNCQILCPPNGKPSVIIHCVQKKFKRRECQLKIGLMVIGYDTDFNFIFSDSNVQVDVVKQDFNARAGELTTLNEELLIGKVPCLGIPVLNKLDSSNNSLIIGHYFFDAQRENGIGTCTFSYCLKEKRYVNLPSFTFYTLIILKSFNSSAFGTTCFRSRILFPTLKKQHYCLNQNPRFISLYSNRDRHRPVFLKQNNEQIVIYDINCRCERCYICKNRLNFDLSSQNMECAYFDEFNPMR